jgi:1-deoxy-D-xylulose-5-phosphate reductoisomerase
LKRRITILGATGSIGSSTLDLIEREPDRFEVVALTAHSDVRKLADIARRTSAKLAVIADERRLPELREALRGTSIAAAGGAPGVLEAAASGADWTMAAIVGCAGLEPVMAAIRGGGTVVLANKEPLVSAGELILTAAATSATIILPADSEHNAIFQCFDFERPERVRRIILTASGGPFRDMSRAEMASVTPEQAVAHPVWSMGAKISIDSATLMNKGLELIEAARLFPVDPARIEIILHRQSVVHSLVEYVDGSMLAQLGSPDMRTPIAHTLAWPDRMETPVEPLDLARIGSLDFTAPDPERFPALRLARTALEAGGAVPAVLNAANEVAVAAFLDRRIAFLQIAAIVEETMTRYEPPAPSTIEDVIAIDREARLKAAEAMKVFVD